MQDENVRVTAARVEHPLVPDAFGDRFDAPDRSIVISGDTRRSDNLVRLARGVDVLVHEPLWVPGVDRLVSFNPNAMTIKKHIIDSHTPVEEVGQVAAAAGVKTLGLSHLVPVDDERLTDQIWIDLAGAHFKGQIVLAGEVLKGRGDAPADSQGGFDPGGAGERALAPRRFSGVCGKASGGPPPRVDYG